MELILELIKSLDLSTWALIALGVALYFTNGNLTKLADLKTLWSQLLAFLERFKPKPQPKLEDKVEEILDRVVKKLLPAVVEAIKASKDDPVLSSKKSE